MSVVAIRADEGLRDDIKRLEIAHATRGMSATIRRVIKLAARKLPKIAEVR